ncbi:MAG: hypothetical protein O2964_06505 [Verrucomicrobia bacterium]|nr:hypothetical protein [Verrucomicrobiota bacterium]
MTLPCTPRGIADWASRRKTAVLVYVLGMGCLVATVMGWFVWTRWLPVWEEAIVSFPPGSRIEKEQLMLASDAGQPLTDNLFLSFEWISDPDEESASTSDIRIIFRSNECRIGSLLGYVSLLYPYGYIIDLDPDKLQPWWLTRRYFFYLGGWGLLWLGMLGCWWGLAIAYAIPVFLLAYFLGRETGVRTVFRLNLMSLMLPALFMSTAFVLYAFRRLNLQEFLTAGVVHIPMAWGLIFLSTLRLDRKKSLSDHSTPAGTLSSNPFGHSESGGKSSSYNPFGGGDKH